jgi:hypothetical protein
MDKELIAQHIVEKIISKHLTFTYSFTEMNEDGSISFQRTERAEAIYNDILKLLEENETNI